MKNYFSLVKFSHTIFALPFALLGFFLAVQSIPDYSFSIRLLVLVLLCMVFARNAAMGFNRYLDRDIDVLNPRTAIREIPAGKVSPQAALTFVGMNCLLFILTTYFINSLCFYLSPVALAIILGYSFTKRFTWLCHFVLGLGLALAPIGAYLAVKASFATLPILYGVAVLFWVSGFDIIYALQDSDFDNENNLHSVPAHFGNKKALMISKVLHLLCAITMTYAAYYLFQTYPQVSEITAVATLIFVILLVYQHSLVRPNDLSKVNLAFFTTNGVASLVLGGLIIFDLLI